MITNNVMKQIVALSNKPNVFERGTGNIWTEEYIAKQMLKAHLDKTSDGASRNIEAIEKTVDFINKAIKKNSTILDLGCGPGLYAERLFQLGHSITGIDFSENTIQYARNHAKQENLHIEYRCEDMFQLNYNKQFDVVMQIYGEINTFSGYEREQIFRIVRDALKPEGVFIFDVTTPVHRKKSGLSNKWYISENGFWRGNRHLVLEEGFAYEDNIWLDQYIVMDEEEIKVYRNWFHNYTKKDIETIVLEAGFTKVNVINSLTGESNSNESEWITVIAEK